MHNINIFIASAAESSFLGSSQLLHDEMKNSDEFLQRQNVSYIRAILEWWHSSQ